MLQYLIWLHGACCLYKRWHLNGSWYLDSSIMYLTWRIFHDKRESLGNVNEAIPVSSVGIVNVHIWVCFAVETSMRYVLKQADRPKTVRMRQRVQLWSLTRPTSVSCFSWAHRHRPNRASLIMYVIVPLSYPLDYCLILSSCCLLMNRARDGSRNNMRVFRGNHICKSDIKRRDIRT